MHGIFLSINNVRVATVLGDNQGLFKDFQAPYLRYLAGDAVVKSFV